VLVIEDNLYNNYCNISLNKTCRDFLYKWTSSTGKKAEKGQIFFKERNLVQPPKKNLNLIFSPSRNQAIAPSPLMFFLGLQSFPQLSSSPPSAPTCTTFPFQLNTNSRSSFPTKRQPAPLSLSTTAVTAPPLFSEDFPSAHKLLFSLRQTSLPQLATTVNTTYKPSLSVNTTPGNGSPLIPSPPQLSPAW